MSYHLPYGVDYLNLDVGADPRCEGMREKRGSKVAHLLENNLVLY